MSFTKYNKTNIGLTLILLFSLLLGVYSVWSYSNVSLTATGIMIPPQFQRGLEEGQAGIPAERESEIKPGRQNGNPLFSNRGRNAFNGPFGTSPDRSGFNGSWRWSGSTLSTDRFSTPLMLYACAFLGVAACAFFLFTRNMLALPKLNKKLMLWTMLGIGFFLRIAIAPWVGGHPYDLGLFKSWATAAASSLTEFYVHGSSDYPPFYIYILYGVGKLVAIPSLYPFFTLLVKLPSLITDVLTAYLIYRLASKHLASSMSVLLAAFYLFNPAVFLNSTFWGQVDSFFTLLIVCALLAVSKHKIGLAAALFTASMLMKPQGIIFAPVLFFELVRLKSVRQFTEAIVAALITAVAIIAPFSIHKEPLWIIDLFQSTLGEYPYASVNAFNLFSLLGANFKLDTSTLFLFSYHTWGLIFIVLTTLYSWFIYSRIHSATFAFAAALVQISGVFTLSTSMHERYLFPAVALGLLAYVYYRDKRLLWLTVGYSATIYVNTHAILYGEFNGSFPYTPTLFITSLLNVVLFVYLAKVVWDLTKVRGACEKPEI